MARKILGLFILLVCLSVLYGPIFYIIGYKALVVVLLAIILAAGLVTGIKLVADE